MGKKKAIKVPISKLEERIRKLPLYHIYVPSKADPDRSFHHMTVELEAIEDIIRELYWEPNTTGGKSDG